MTTLVTESGVITRSAEPTFLSAFFRLQLMLGAILSGNVYSTLTYRDNFVAAGYPSPPGNHAYPEDHPFNCIYQTPVLCIRSLEIK